MALVSKKTIRKWASVLTSRGLTFDNADGFTQSGNSVAVKQKVRRVGLFTINEKNGLVTWKVGCVWCDGTLVTINGSLKPGDSKTLTFNANDHRPRRIYCKLDFTHVAALNQTTITTPPDPEEVSEFYTTIRAAASGSADFEMGLVEDETEAFLSTPAIINTITNAGTTGTKRIPVADLTWVEADPPDIPKGYWTIAVNPAANPSGLIAFNINDYSDSRTWPTINELALV
jgi:hypothetical protein